LTEKKVPDKT